VTAGPGVWPSEVIYCTLADTDALAFSVNVHVLRLFPPLEHAPDQTASRPFETVNVMDVPFANAEDPVLPTETLIPPGLDVTRSPLRPLADTVSVDEPAGGGGGGADGGVTLRTLDHAPAAPAELRPRTRHQCCTPASEGAVNCDAVVVWSMTSGVENPLELSTWI
jgi:hypothetical protein